MILMKEDVYSNLSVLDKSIFVYPTDSIYGIGCDANNFDLIARLREIKHRYTKPFSIIAPSVQWVKDNFVLNDVEIKLVEKFGSWIEVDGVKKPSTLLLTPKDINLFPENLTFGLPKIGVRIPKHWISGLVEKIGAPIVTTSVNVSGDAHMTSIDNIDDDIKKYVDLIIDDGELKGKPSTILTVNGLEVVYLKR